MERSNRGIRARGCVYQHQGRGTNLVLAKADCPVPYASWLLWWLSVAALLPSRGEGSHAFVNPTLAEEAAHPAVQGAIAFGGFNERSARVKCT